MAGTAGTAGAAFSDTAPNASKNVFVPMGNDKFCTSPEPKLPYQYGKRNGHLMPIVNIDILN